MRSILGTIHQAFAAAVLFAYPITGEWQTSPTQEPPTHIQKVTECSLTSLQFISLSLPLSPLPWSGPQHLSPGPQQEPSGSLPPGGSEVCGKCPGFHVGKSRIKFLSPACTGGTILVGFHFLILHLPTGRCEGSLRSRRLVPGKSRFFLPACLLSPPFHRTAVQWPYSPCLKYSRLLTAYSHHSKVQGKYK